MRLRSLSAVVLLFLAVVFCRVDSDDSQCGPGKRCSCSNFIMDCRHMELAEIPKDVPKDIKALYMNNNAMKTLIQIEFEPEDPDLQTLVLSGNEIKELQYDAFDNLDALKTLRLSYNNITSIADDIFEWNPLKLEVLYLDNNGLEFIQHFLFYDLEQLTDLYLQNNNITFIHPHAFLQLKNLRNLRVEGNRLHTFNPKWIEKLQANAFTQLAFDPNPWSCDCAMSRSHKWLHNDKSQWFRTLVGDNAITCFSPKNLTHRHLYRLTKTEVGKTCNMPKITGISKPSSIKTGSNVLLRCIIDENLFPVPTISWTAPNNDIYRLNTAGNFDGIEVHQTGSLLISNLSGIDDGQYTCNASNSEGSFTATTKITVLDEKIEATGKLHEVITKSPDKALTAGPYKPCPDACQCISRHIDCSGDGTTVKSSIPPRIPADAITISLASNKLTKLGDTDFTVFQSLEELRLDDNIISTITSKAFFYLTRLTTLTLQQNKLMEIMPGTFSTLKSLNVLVLDKNRLTKLTKDMFEGLEDLQWLYVRHNTVSKIDVDAFGHLKRIKFIHLEGNELGLIHPRTIQTLITMPERTVKRVFVDDNNFQCDCQMEDMRQFVRKDILHDNELGDFFGDGIICSYPPDLADMQLANMKSVLTCPEDFAADLQPETSSSYSGLLFGGIAVGVVLTIIVAILYRKYGRSVRQSGKSRSYNYSNLNGNDESERSGLTENMGTSGSEAFV